MVPNVYEVSPNLTVRACQTKKLKAGMISLSAVLPIEKEHAHLNSLLLSVLHRGTQKYPTIAALNRRLDYLFGTDMTVRNYYRGDRHIIGIAADLLGNDYLPDGVELMEDVLEVMREILFCPRLDENGLFEAHYVESEKKLQREAIQALKNSPRAYAIEHCSAALYENEACGTPICGTEELVDAITPQALTDRWREMIANLALECFYVGPEEPAMVAERAGRILSPCLPEYPVARQLPMQIGKTEPDKIRRREESLSVAQGQLVIGLRTGTSVEDPDYYACAVANEMLGVSPVSKLFVNVREKHGLCYHCSSHFNLYKGVILISCGLLPQNREVAEREIFKQIEALAGGDFDDGELFSAILSLQNGYRQIEDNPTSLESYYFGRALCGVSDTLAEFASGIESVTREDIIRVARKWATDTVYFLDATAPQEEREVEHEEV